jgi:hypothetical protein
MRYEHIFSVCQILFQKYILKAKVIRMCSLSREEIKFGNLIISAACPKLWCNKQECGMLHGIR